MNKVLQVENIGMENYKGMIFTDISFKIDKGEIVGLLGHNGSGKSTIQRIIANYEPAQKGEVAVNGMINDINIQTKDVILIPDTIQLFKNKSIKENFDIICIGYNANVDFLNKYMDILDLKDNDIISSLSKGNQEIIQLLIYLSIDTHLYLLDEPFSAVDIYRRELIQKIIVDVQLRQPDSSFIITTHLISEVELILDRVLYLHNGKILFDEEVEQLLVEADSLTSYLKQYFKEELGYDKVYRDAE